jgi:hypothetical protein
VIDSNVVLTEDDLKEQIEVLEGEVQSLLKKKENKEQNMKKLATEVKSKKDQLTLSQGNLHELKCELEMLNFFLSKQQFNKGKLVPPKISAQEAINLEREVDKAIIKELKSLENSVKAPVFDSLATNYTTGFFTQNKMISTYITIQKLDIPIDKLYDLETYEGYGATFRISKTTNFYMLWTITCNYWGVHIGQYRLMDKYFNDLSTYDDTIENYIREYKDIQKNKEVVIYLVNFPYLPKYPHPTTANSKFSFKE